MILTRTLYLYFLTMSDRSEMDASEMLQDTAVMTQLESTTTTTSSSGRDMH